MGQLQPQPLFVSSQVPGRLMPNASPPASSGSYQPLQHRHLPQYPRVQGSEPVVGRVARDGSQVYENKHLNSTDPLHAAPCSTFRPSMSYGKLPAPPASLCPCPCAGQAHTLHSPGTPSSGDTAQQTLGSPITTFLEQSSSPSEHSPPLVPAHSSLVCLTKVHLPPSLEAHKSRHPIAPEPTYGPWGCGSCVDTSHCRLQMLHLIKPCGCPQSPAWPQVLALPSLPPGTGLGQRTHTPGTREG